MDIVKKKIHYWCADTIYRANRGQGIGVAVFDTGIAPHPDVKERVVDFLDMVNGRNSLYDDSGHGTHVCGILCGSGGLSGGKYEGIASGVSLVVVKVLGANGEGTVEQIIQGIQWVLKNRKRYRIRIANLSVGSKQGMDPDKERKMLEAVEAMWDAGIAVIVSAGNQESGNGTVTIPGNSRKVITVGAVEQTGNKQGTSGRGSVGNDIVKPDMVAPGYQIFSCNYQFTENRKLEKNMVPYIRKSGTSMATPVVSGAAALYFYKYPEADNQTFKRSLQKSCVRRPGVEGQGWGSLRMDQLLSER